MVKEYTLALRNRAVGMLEAGSRPTEVSKALGVPTRTLRNWRRRNEAGDSLENKPGRGRKEKITRVPKIVISKSLNKRGQSTRKLARRLTRNGYPMSHATVHEHLKKSMQVQPFKPRRVPMLTRNQVRNRIEWCKERRLWSISDWKRVIFSDESSFEIFHPRNKQNDRVWAKNIEDVPTTPSVKFPSKVMVWGAMSYRALSELHFVPEKTTVNTHYYVDEILEKSLLQSLNRTRNSGSTLKMKFMPDMSEAIFQQDGAPAHRAKTAQKWLQDNVNSFWSKDQWPGNSPDLNPIENV